MKFSATAILGLAPLALGKAINNVYPKEQRDGHLKSAVIGGNSVHVTPAQLADLSRLIGLNPGSGTSINFLWVNLGGGAATTVIGTASTVTVTQTINVPGATGAPNAVVTDAPTTTQVVGAGATHSVTVGGPQGLSFSPQEIKAAVGDTVIFTFLSQNHTATQSSFEQPCVPLDGGMDSGYQANPNNTVNPPPQVAMQVMVDTPLWFFCKQGPHCGRGMVFSINPTAEKTHAKFQEQAIAQAGNGAGSAITGNAPPAVPGNDNAAADPSASSSLEPLPSATDSAGAPAAPTDNSGVATGIGEVLPDGACRCAVQCTFNGFPSAQIQGRDAFGGFGGSVPMAMVM
ncbi:hypothetical protein VTJ04DRAFT_9188 [Mycothermus thermophilus]|uniref:uncharacterized protein n=1 Tax=Humicola insolens TaxID=85995 RepID=UPI0037423269